MLSTVLKCLPHCFPHFCHTLGCSIFFNSFANSLSPVKNCSLKSVLTEEMRRLEKICRVSLFTSPIHTYQQNACNVGLPPCKRQGANRTGSLGGIGKGTERSAQRVSSIVLATLQDPECVHFKLQIKNSARLLLCSIHTKK